MADMLCWMTTEDGEVVEPPRVVLAATDVFALAALTAYRDLVDALHPDRGYVHDVMDFVGDFALWRRLHLDQVKIPD
jgi:hypothetical protein